MKHFVAPLRLTLSAAVLLAVIISGQTARAVNNTYTGPDLGNWNVDANWTLLPPLSGAHFIPDSGFNEAAAIGDTGFLNLTVLLNVPATNSTTGGDVAGLRLGVVAGSVGGLRIGNGGVLRSVVAPGTQTPPVEMGGLFIGVAGQGNLTVLGGGRIEGTSITMAGAANTSMALGDTSGLTATVVVNGTANLARVTTVTGPNVSFNATGALTVSGGTLVADIRNATTHSALRGDGTATVGGTVRPMFTGFTPAAGNRWRLVDVAGAITGNFTTLDKSALTMPAGLDVIVVPGTNGARNTRDLLVEEELILQVNRDTGTASIANVGAANKNIDGYSILSPNGWLNGTTWNSLDDQNIGGANAWVEAGPTANALSELNPGNVGTGFTTVNAGTSLNLGTPYAVNTATFPPLGTNPDNLTFEYSGPDGRTIQGAVVYSGTRVVNDVILSVDPATGMAALKNDSPYTIVLDGYSIYSDSGSLVPGTWSSLQDQAIAGWEEAAPTANALAELKANGTLTLTPGTGFGLGAAFKTVGTTQDLRLQYLQPGAINPTLGQVIYGPFTIPPAPGGGVTGDYNGNGTVDAADYVLWRNGGPLLNDPTAGVQAGDYDVWRANFGRTSGSGSAAATAAPEPSTLMLLCLASSALVCLRRK